MTTFSTGQVLTADELNAAFAAIPAGPTGPPGPAGSSNFTQSGTGAVTRPATDKLKETVSVKDFGAVGDGTTNDYAAIMAAIASLGSVGGVVLFPAGVYKVNSTIELTTCVHLFGSSPGHATQGDQPSVRLVFPIDTSGIIVQRYNTTGLSGVLGSPRTTGGDGSVIDGLQLEGSGAGGNGITLRARAHVRNFQIYGFNHCIAVTAGTDGVPVLGNANNWRVDQGRTYGAVQCGVYVTGTDANAGHCSNVDAGNCGAYGFYEASFLRNLYTACHAANCTTANYYATNYSLFMGCYSESGVGGDPNTYGASIHLNPFFDAPPVLTGDTVIIGATNADLAGGALTVNRPIKVGAYNDATKTFSYGANGVLTAHVDTAYFPSGVYTGGDLSAPTNFVTKYGISSAVYWDVNTGPSTTLTFRRSGAVPYAKFIPKLFVGNGRDSNTSNTVGGAICSDGAGPTTGEWAKGDVVFNINAAPGGFAGWICTTAGTPGVWKQFGAISA